MLQIRDARPETDQRIAEAVARWARLPFEVLPFTRELDSANRLRQVMEGAGRTGSVRPVTIDHQPAFVYVCLGDRQQPFAQGVGSTPALAICDAFLLCCPEAP
jgi:hypothetical protein